MYRLLAYLCLALTLAGCSLGGSSAPPTSTALPAPTASASATSGAPPAPGAAPSPTVTVGKPYLAFVHRICRAFRTHRARVIMNSLPYYQYNSGLRYGMLGDGEGQTGDPSLMRTWLTGSRVRCMSFSPGLDGHGTLLTVGWLSPARVALLDLDIFNGHWKINDFTFGSRAALNRAMHTSSPILSYR